MFNIDRFFLPKIVNKAMLGEILRTEEGKRIKLVFVRDRPFTTCPVWGREVKGKCTVIKNCYTVKKRKAS